MPKTRKRAREKARLMFMGGESSSNAAIARELQLKPHTVASWRREEDWDALRLKADRRAAEKLVEQLSTDRAELNTRHFKLWDAILTRAVILLKDPGAHGVAGIERVAAILERAQKGQRLAKEMASAAEAAESANAQAAANLRMFTDMFITAVMEYVDDESTRENLRTAILRSLPEGPSSGTGEPGDEGVH